MLCVKWEENIDKLKYTTLKNSVMAERYITEH